MASSGTRSKSRHSVFGFPKELAKNVLPTCEDVFRAYCYYQQLETHQTVNDVAKTVANEVTEVYNTASIPVIAFDSVVKKIKRLIERGNDLQKYPESKRTSATYQTALSSFNDLFDICTCKCVDAGILDRKDCKCHVECKIPIIEWNFWVDQKTVKKMVIGKIDPVVTGHLQKLENRKQKAAKFEAKTRAQMDEGTVISEDLEMELCSGNDSDNQDVDSSYLQDEETEEDSDNEASSSTVPKNRWQYPELCRAVDRANVSNRDTVLIVNAVLKDLGLLTPENALQPSKLRRQRDAWRKKSIQDHKEETEGIVCLGFDGKIDVTLKHTGCTRWCTLVSN